MTADILISYGAAGVALTTAIVAVRAWHAGNRRTAIARARLAHGNRLLRFIKRTHRLSDLYDEDGFTLCAECGKPHPCETYRTASGDPGWPRNANDVLAEMDTVPQPEQGRR